MDANEVYQALGERSRYDEVGKWAIVECGKLRQHVVKEQAECDDVKQNDAYKSRSISIYDVNEEYISQTDMGDVLRAFYYAHEELKRIPPEYPTSDEAVFWMARSRLLLLISIYSQALVICVDAQRNLHNYKKGLCEAEVKNLLCEPGDNDDKLFSWSALLVALHGDMDHVESNHTMLTELVKLFGWIADVYYDTTQAVYSTKLVGKCRRAFGAFWRRIGDKGFGPHYNEYIKCRAALDTAIMNNVAGKFASYERCTNSLTASMMGINKSLVELKSKTMPQIEANPHKRGPKGAHKQVPIKHAATVYGVSEATISNWDKGEGGVPIHYPGRDVSIDEFDYAAYKDNMAMGHKEGVMSRVAEARGRW